MGKEYKCNNCGYETLSHFTRCQACGNIHVYKIKNKMEIESIRRTIDLIEAMLSTPKGTRLNIP